jgi:outer membrane protein assembly factor BamB
MRILLLAWLCGAAFWATAAEQINDDWPGWRGADRTNLCQETGLLPAWPDGGPPLLWSVDSLGQGYSAFAIVDGVLYTMGNRDGQEEVLALDVLRQGAPRWATSIGPVRHDGAGYPGPRSTPTHDQGRLYTLGLNGDLVCLDAKTGKLLWRHDLVAEFGGKIPTWGYSESVLVDGPWVLCTPGGSQATLLALDKVTGHVAWKAAIGDGAAYASIVTARPAGIKQYVQFTAQGLVGVRAQDGAFLWRYNAPANGTANIATPIAHDDLVFAASGYGTGGGLIRIEPEGRQVVAKEVYFTKNLKNHHGGMVLVGDYLYGANDPGLLTCLHLASGKVQWTSRAPGKCSVLYADGHIYARSEEGKVSLVEATPRQFMPRGQFDQPRRSSQPSWTHPVICRGRLYLRDQGMLLCYDVREEPGAGRSGGG